MDPLSIASASGSLAVLCVKVASTILDITSSIQNIDENLSSLRQELLSLSGVLEGIENTWKKNHDRLVAYSGADINLWTSIIENVTSGRETIIKLEKAFEKVNKPSSFSNSFLRRPVKALKFSLSSDDIGQYRQRIGSHQLAMQSGLQMIILCLQIQETTSTQNVDSSLSTLETMINTITARLETLTTNLTRPTASDSTSKTSISSGNPGKDGVISSLQTMQQAAKSLHSSASTVIEGRRSTVYDGSVVGDPLSEDQFRNISDWIPPTKDDLPQGNTSHNQFTPTANTGTNDTQNTTNSSAPNSTSTAPINRPGSNLLDRAIDLVRQAITYDNNAEYEKAYQKYQMALEVLVTALRFEQNPRLKDLIRAKTDEYLSRAELIKKHLDSEKPSLRSTRTPSATQTTRISSSTTSTSSTSSANTIQVSTTQIAPIPGSPHVLPPAISNELFVSFMESAKGITSAHSVQIITSDDTMFQSLSEALKILCIPSHAKLFLSAIISPLNLKNLQGLLSLFHRAGIPVWPFYSDDEEDFRHAIPRVPGSVGLDVAKYMDKIVEVNEEQMYAVVEPGVSYADLTREISDRGLDGRVLIDWPGSSDELIIGRVLENGCAEVLGMEIVLPQGDIVRTGVLSSREERWLPKVDRTFERSLANGMVPVQCIGVVAKIAVNLYPKISECQPFLITFSENEDFSNIIASSQTLLQRGLIHHDLRLRHILLESAVISIHAPLKKNTTSTQRNQSAPTSLIQEQQLDNWNLYGVINSDQLDPVRNTIWQTIKSSFKEFNGVTFHLTSEETPVKFRKYIQERSSPRFSSLTDKYKLRRNGTSVDKAHIMCSRASRIATGQTARTMHNVCEELVRGGNVLPEGCNPMVEFVLEKETGRIIQNIHILFPVRDPDSSKKVQIFVRKLFEDGIERLWEDLKTHPVLMDQIVTHSSSTESDFWLRAMVAAAKDAVDTKGILAPGRHGVWPKQASSKAWEAVIEEF